MILHRIAILALALAAVPALAHPKVEASTPAAGATVAAPAQISLQMSEPLVAKLSGATLTMTGMPGMADHAPMVIAVKSSVGPDGKTLLLSPTKKLPAGHYRVDWHVVSTDTHRVVGTHEFSVK
jgi:methionine-rich copper-binding protein CopC